MQIDKKLSELPLTKSKSSTLQALFGKTDIEPFWVADMEYEIAKPIQDSLIQRISNSSFGYEYKPDTFFNAQKNWYQKNYEIELHNNHIIYSPSITTTIAVLIENFTSQQHGIIIQPLFLWNLKTPSRKQGEKL